MRNHAFTLVELLLAISLMAVVMLAMALFMTATAEGWKTTDDSRRATMGETRLSSRLENVLRPAKHIVLLPSGNPNPTAILYWAYDGLGGSTDAFANRGEIGLLVWDAQEKLIRHFAPSRVIDQSDLPDATATTFGNLSAASTIKTISQWSYLQPAEIIAGPADLEPSTNSTLVTGFSVQKKAASGSRPILWYSIDLADRDGQLIKTCSGSIVIRAPASPPNLP